MSGYGEIPDTRVDHGHVPDTCYNTAGHVTHSSLATTATDVTDEGYDSASRELELINSRKLYTIV